MKKEIKILKDADKHPIDEYLVDNEGNYSCYSCTCNEVANEQHDKVDADLRLGNVIIMAASILLYVNLHALHYLIPFLFCLLSFTNNMIADKCVQLLYGKMSECVYYEDTEVLFNKHWNKYGRWHNKLIWGSFILGIISLLICLFI